MRRTPRRNGSLFNILLVLGLIGGAALFAHALNPPAPSATDSGVWTFVPKDQRAVHVGANGQVDTVTPRLKSSSGTVVEMPSELVVTSPGQAEHVPKATPSASRIEPAPAGSTESAVAVPGGSAIVYRDAGVIETPGRKLTLPGPIGDVVADDKHVLWAESGNNICSIGPSEEAVPSKDCFPFTPPAKLTTMRGEPYLVADSANSIRLVSKEGLAAAIDLPVDLPADAVLTTRTFEPVLGAFLPSSSQVDIFKLNDKETGVKVERFKVPPGDYGALAVAPDFFVLLAHDSSEFVVGDVHTGKTNVHKLNVDGKDAQPLATSTGVVYITEVGGSHVFTIDGPDHVIDAPTGAAAHAAAEREKPAHAPKKAPRARRSPTSAQPPRKAERPGMPEAAGASAGDSSADVFWAPSAIGGNVDHYTVRWSATGAAGEQRVDGASTGTHVDGLTNGITYVFSVTAVNSVGSSPPATTPPVTPTPHVPGIVTGVVAVAQRDGTVRLNWTMPSGGPTVARYRIVVRTGGSSLPVDTVDARTTVALSENDGLRLGVDYVVSVLAVDGAGRVGPPSDPASFRLARPADPPTALTATPAGSGSLDISWQAPSMNGGALDHYVVQLDGGVAAVKVTGTRVVIGGLNNGRTYRVNVAARTKSSTGTLLDGQAATTTATVGTPPGVSNVSARLSGDRQVNVAFTAADNGSGAVTCHIYFDGAQRWSGGCGGTSDIAVGGLDYSHSYDIWVTASNSFGSSPDSNHVSVQTNNAPAVTVSKGAPKGCSGCTTVVIALTDFPPNTGYTVDCYSDMDSSPFFSYRVTTDGNGYSQSGECFYGYPGRAVWAVAGGVTSARVTW